MLCFRIATDIEKAMTKTVFHWRKFQRAGDGGNPVRVFLKEYPFQAAVRNSEILGIFSLRVGTDVFPALRERGMNTIFSGVRLYLGGITIIRLSSYVQDAEPFLCDLIEQ